MTVLEINDESYNIVAIRELINRALDDEQFATLCRRNFTSVHNQFTDGMDRPSKVSTLIRYCKDNKMLGHLLTCIEQINPDGCCDGYRNSEFFKGSEILCLFKGLDTEQLIEDVQALYESAYNNRFNDSRGAIESCHKALNVLAQESSKGHSNPEGLAYARGKCNLLSASIYLNLENSDVLGQVVKHYSRSQDEFHKWQWKHLESLAFLGLAITHRKLAKDFNEAMNACKKAQDCVAHESILDSIDTTILYEAIKRERLTIQKLLSAQLLEEDEDMLKGDEEGFSIPFVQEKPLQIFRVSKGDNLMVAEGTTTLNLLSRKDFAKDVSASPEEVIINLGKRVSALKANYILEIDEDVKTDVSLEQGDWVLIRTTKNLPKELDGKTVVVLVRKGGEICVGLKTFINAEDHYFLKAQVKGVESIIIAHYKSDIKKISNYYTIDHKNVVGKRAYDVKICGVVIQHGRLSKQLAERVTDSYIWRVPKVSNLVAGFEAIAADDKVQYISFREKKRKGKTNYFIFVVKGNSMINAGIKSGDQALIKQQANVQDRDIAAVVISTPNNKPLGLLKQYRVYDHPSWPHWFLKSANPLAQDLVVIPSNTDATLIKKMYANKIEAKKVVLFENAELKIVGKFIKVIE